MSEVPGFNPEQADIGAAPPTAEEIEKTFVPYLVEAQRRAKTLSEHDARYQMLRQASDYEAFAKDLERGYGYEDATDHGPRPGKHWRPEDARKLATMLREEAQKFAEFPTEKDIQKEVAYYLSRFEGIGGEDMRRARQELLTIADEFETFALDKKSGNEDRSTVQHRSRGSHWRAEDYAALAGALRAAADKEFPE